MLSLDLHRKPRNGLFAIDMTVTTRERIVALSGPSGSGKTTMLKMIAGLIDIDHGHLRVGDHTLFDSQHNINQPAWRRRIGFVFQDNRLFPHLSVKQNLHYGRVMNRLPRDHAHENHVIAMLDIGALLPRGISDLSGGEQQRVAMGRALLSKPLLLLLDEPMSSLDQARKREIQPYLLRLAQEGVPMIYVSHDADEIAQLAGCVLHVAHGQASLPPAA